MNPYLLASVGRRSEARDVLARIGEPHPDAALEAITQSMTSEVSGRREPLFQARYRNPVILAIAIGAFNQLSRIDAILHYLNDIFERASFSTVSSDMQAVAIGFTNLLFTLIAMQAIRSGVRRCLVGSVNGET